jgi:hypothetical protein
MGSACKEGSIEVWRIPSRRLHRLRRSNLCNSRNPRLTSGLYDRRRASQFHSECCSSDFVDAFEVNQKRIIQIHGKTVIVVETSEKLPV